VSGAEIVERGEEAARTVVGENVYEMIELVDTLRLRDLEEDLLGRKATFLRCLQGTANAQGRLIDRIGKKLMLRCRSSPRRLARVIARTRQA
jgi:hypothetical protein